MGCWTLNMRFSYNILFLGLWLTGQCWVPGETAYPKPSISVYPSETVALGGTVNIHCKNEDKQIPEGKEMEFHLEKQVSSYFKTERKEVAKHDEVVFPIVNATPSHAGIYRCIYCFKTLNCQSWSYFSDSVNINIRETAYPKPSISVYPSETVALGGTVNIHCKKEEPEQISEGIKIQFHLQKEVSSDFEMVREEVAEHDEVVFPIVSATPSHAGIYRCLYCFKTYNCRSWSYYSDSVNISIRGQVHNTVSSSENASETNNKDGYSSTIIWAGAAAGCLILVLFLLLLALVLYRRRKKGSTTHERTQPLPMKETSLPLAPVAEEEAEDDPDEVSYAVLSHYSLKRQEHAEPDSIPESCVYASVADGIARKSQ